MSETTRTRIDEAADLRGVLLTALGMGEGEAEHLTGPQLVLRLVEAHRDVTGRLEAASYTAQRLACDVQELLSGEEYERLRGELVVIGEEVARLTAENVRLRARVQELESATREVRNA